MSKFQSTKVLELGSCAFRQPKAESHCRFLHGYRLTAKFWFEAKELDINNWILDFGSLKDFKGILRDQFDHTTCIASDDPVLPLFKQLHENGVADLRIMDSGVGIEKFAEWCYKTANKWIPGKTDNRCKCVKVEVFEHVDNSAIFEEGNESYKDLTRPPFSKENTLVQQELKLDMGEPYADARGVKKEPYTPATKAAVTQEPKTDSVIEVTNTEGEVKEEEPEPGPTSVQHGLGPGQTRTSGSWVDPAHKGKTKNSWLF